MPFVHMFGRWIGIGIGRYRHYMHSTAHIKYTILFSARIYISKFGDTFACQPTIKVAYIHEHIYTYVQRTNAYRRVYMWKIGVAHESGIERGSNAISVLSLLALLLVAGTKCIIHRTYDILVHIYVELSITCILLLLFLLFLLYPYT